MTLSKVPQKIIDAIVEAKLLSESLLQKGPKDLEGIEAYKNALRCRSNVQYAIALLRIDFGLQNIDRPKIKGRFGLDVNLAKIKDLLSSAAQSVDSQNVNDAFEDLLTADVILSKTIGIMRRKNRLSCIPG